ncbi:MAG: cobalt-precorrin-5B (C(1))-methyltransferase [Desulfovibrio sp.]|nr:cobalt-precorrin-5B (C(1))-methyltransferase [Desulfovibrio sp.]
MTPGTPVTNGERSGKDAPAPTPGPENFEKNREGPIHILISVTEGENLARRTMNPRLGVIGGISILGTRGIVRPYSHEAWTKTIEQSLDVAAAMGLSKILVSTGRRSARLGLALYPRFAEQSCIQAADHAAFTLRAAAGKNFFTHLFWACFPGKLLKLAQRLENTHAWRGSSDLALVADICREEGADLALESALRACPTISAAFTLLDDEPGLRFVTLTRLGRAAFAVMGEWLASARPSPSFLPELRLHVFSTDERLLLTLPEPGGYGSD